MLSNKQLKYIRSLHQRKYRQKYHNFIAEGEKIIDEILSGASKSVEAIYAIPEWIEGNGELVKNGGFQVVEIEENELKKISLLNTPNKVLGIFRKPDYEMDFETVKNDFSLYLDDIRDPGNMGTILRIADWFGIEYVFCSKGCVEVFNPKVVQATMGAFLRVKTLGLEFDELLSDLGGKKIYGAILGGESIYEADLSGKSMLVIGNESRGISPVIQEKLTKGISIPKHERGGAESLNASVATGILCAHFRSIVD